jgi:hypothetical protein
MVVLGKCLVSEPNPGAFCAALGNGSSSPSVALVGGVIGGLLAVGGLVACWYVCTFDLLCSVRFENLLCVLLAGKFSNRRKQARERAEAGDFINLAAQSREMLNA